jgi:hypothetical protein
MATLMLITSALVLTLFISSVSSSKEYVILDDTFDDPVLVEKTYIKKWSITESRYIVDNLDRLNDMLFKNENAYKVVKDNPPPFDPAINQETFVWQQPAPNVPRDFVKHHFVPRHSFNKESENMGNDLPVPPGDDQRNALVAKKNAKEEDADQVLLQPKVRNDKIISNEVQAQPPKDTKNNYVYYHGQKANEIPRVAPERQQDKLQYFQNNIPGRNGHNHNIQTTKNTFSHFDNGVLHHEPRVQQAAQKPVFVRHKFIHSKTIHNFPIERIRKQDSKIPKEFFNIKTTINPHNFTYIINPTDTCQRVNGTNIFLIVPIISSVDNFNLRQTVRKTWGQFSAVYGLQVRFVFMLGASKLPYLQDFVKQESNIYGDIVQESFIDTYVNSTLKAIFTLRWVQTYCANAKFMLRLNDDVMINVYKFIPYLQDRGLPEKKLYWGQVYHDSRANRGLAKHEYRSKIMWQDGGYYPPYCNGPYILMTMDVVKSMYKMSWRTPLMFPEDVYYGILAEKLGVRTFDASMHLVDQNEVQSPVQKFKIDRENTRPEMIGHLGSDNKTVPKIEYLWKLVEKRTKDKRGCVKRQFNLKKFRAINDDIDNRIPPVAN